MGLSENLKSTSWSHYSTQLVASIAILANKLSKPNLFLDLYPKGCIFMSDDVE